MIPKIIHQIWFGDKNKRPKELMQTWKDKNPTWEYNVWTEENLIELRNRKQFDLSPEYCGKADIARYEILHKYGGFYIDADSECIKPLEDWLLDNDSFASYESEHVVPGLIANGYLGSIKENELMKILIDSISTYKEPWIKQAACSVTGPYLLTNTINSKNYQKIKLYPSYYFMPKHCRSPIEYQGPGPVFAKQYWGSSLFLYGKLK